MVTCKTTFKILNPADLEDFVNKSTHVVVSLNMHFMETGLLSTCSLACISHFQHNTPFHLIVVRNNKQT